MGEPRSDAPAMPDGVLIDDEYRLAMANLPDYVVLLDRDRRFRWLNRVAPGLTPPDVLGKRLDDFVAPTGLAIAIATVEHTFATGEPGEYEVEAYGDGRTTHWYWTRVVSATREGGPPRVLLVTRDITNEKRVELALRASERRFRAFLDGMPDYVIELDADHRIRYTNRIHPDGSGSDAILGQRIENLALPEMHDEVRRKLDHLFATGEEVRWSSGSVVDPGQYLVRAVRLPGGPPTALVVATDVSRERDAAERLHVSEERLGRAIAAGRVAVWEMDLETGDTTIHGADTRELGAPSERTKRSSLLESIHPDDRAHVERALDAHLRGETAEYESEHRVRAPAADEWRWFLHRARIVDLGRGRRVLAGTSVDVTDARRAEARKRELERQVEQSQRLESVGILAGGIAHDFNNLLTVILASADHARSTGNTSIEDVDVIIEAARQAARLTQQLLAFSGRRELARESVDVAALVQNVLALARPTMPETVDIQLTELPSDVFVLGDRGQLEQVLMNLCLNARDAMPRGGTLRLAVEVGDRHVSLVVGDTGTGVAPEHLPHIFEPFFTTKSVGRGTGLGLAVAHGIVQQHEGDIRAISQVGRGTEMRVGLPRHFSGPSRPSVARAPVPSGRGTVLLAEDEPMLRTISARILSEAGYRVIAVKDGLEAVLEFEARGAEIDVLLLDVRMPRLDGVAAAQRIRAHRADIPVLFCSGYSESDLSRDPALGDGFIAKPYRADELLAALAAVLAASGAARTRS